MRVLWLCADDYALSAGVGAGVRQLLQAGRLSAVSAMATSPLWPREARALRELDPRQVGLHLDLTHFPPLGRLPVLAPAGSPPRLARLIAGALRGAIGGNEVAEEFRRQLDRFETEFGAPPKFMDGHQHVHVLPGVRDALFAALSERGPAFRPWIRNPADRIGRILRRRRHIGKAIAVAGLAAGFDPSAQGFGQNDGFSGFSAFDPRCDVAKDFARFLVAPGARHLAMCHPGADPEADADPIAARRRLELGFLASAEFDELLARTQFSLSHGPLFMPS